MVPSTYLCNQVLTQSQLHTQVLKTSVLDFILPKLIFKLFIILTYGQYFFSLQLFNELSISFNYSTIFLQLFQLSTILFYTNIFFNYFNFQQVQQVQLFNFQLFYFIPIYSSIITFISIILFQPNILFNYYVYFNYTF